MTSALNTTRHEIVFSKLGKLLEQCKTLSIEDFPYPDSKAALAALRAQAEWLKQQSGDFSHWSDNMQKQFSLQVNYRLESISWILGILARSNSMRNSFELYDRFKRLCQDLLGDSVHLILSSEWNYAPFTYPMNLQELPDFIIIGLPAPESNNVLIFPAAGHELGHSIWLNSEMTKEYSSAVYGEISEYAKRSTSLLSALIPSTSDEAQDDLFAKQITEQFISDATDSCLRQMEEIFCDFVGLQIFGESYLHAFMYLIAPGGGGRSLEYPPTKERARLLDAFGSQLGITLEGYVDEFTDGRDSRANPYETLILRAADAVRDKFVQDIYTAAAGKISRAGLAIAAEDDIEKSLLYFCEGMPTDKVDSIGSLIAAAWRLYLDREKRQALKGSQSAIGYVSDLVLKSVEAHDFRMEMMRAER